MKEALYREPLGPSLTFSSSWLNTENHGSIATEELMLDVGSGILSSSSQL